MYCTTYDYLGRCPKLAAYPRAHPQYCTDHRPPPVPKPPPDPRVPLSLRVPVGVLVRLRERAGREGCSQNDLAVRILASGLKDMEQEQTDDRRTKEIAGPRP
jgi:hypothetical protein